MDDDLTTVNVDTEIQEILLAATNHDIPKLRELIRLHENSSSSTLGNPVNVKDPETGFAPLHAAIAACEEDDDDHEEEEEEGEEEPNATNGMMANGDNNHANGDSREGNCQSSVSAVRFLLGEGAIWNDLDLNDETPGCIARRIGATELYDVMVDAGVRAELLLNRLEGYEQLEDDDEDEDEAENQHTEAHTTEAPSSTENNAHYLSSYLTFQPDRLLDQDHNGVMMSWERDIMNQTARKLLPTPGLRVLNIGHGMGIVDSALQSLSPSCHYIVEAHPAVVDEMRRTGWLDKPGVHVRQGRWQDVLPALCTEGVTFDAIYYDTFAESYADFRSFFDEMVIGLLEETGRWSFFNGMGADRQISYDVYQKVVEMDLFEAGFDVEWEDLSVAQLEGEWQGVRPYWAVQSYRLPLCKFMD